MCLPLSVQFEGKHLRVDAAAAQKKEDGAAPAAGGGVSYDPARTIFLGNLHFEIEVRLALAWSRQ
jgi:hypothetical protein